MAVGESFQTIKIHVLVQIEKLLMYHFLETPISLIWYLLNYSLCHFYLIRYFGLFTLLFGIPLQLHITALKLKF